MQPEDPANQPGTNPNPTVPSGAQAWPGAESQQVQPVPNGQGMPMMPPPAPQPYAEMPQMQPGTPGTTPPPQPMGMPPMPPQPQVFVSGQPQPGQPWQGQAPGALPQPMPGPMMMPNQQPMTGMPGGQPKSSTTKIIIWVIVALAVIGLIGFGVKEILAKSNQTKTSNATNHAAQSAQTASGATDISKLKNFNFTQPSVAQLNGMQQGASINNLTTFVSSDAACTIAFGKAPQSALAGSNLGDVVSKLVSKVKSLDPSVKVNGPNTVGPRVLKGSDGKSYSLPTANFSYTGSTSGQAYSIDVTYSISQLSDGSHAVVLVECTEPTANDTATVSSRVKSLDLVVNAIGVQVE